MTKRVRATLVALPLLASLLLLAAFIPAPYVVFSPGMTVDILGTNGKKEVVQVEGHKVFRDEGQLRMTTVYVTQPDSRISIYEAVVAWLDPDRSIYPRNTIYTEDITTEQNREEGAVQMVSSQDAATANALRELGYEIPEVIEVLGVSKGMPAEGKLATRDILTRIGGVEIEDADDVVRAVTGAPKGKPLAFDVLRAGKPVSVEVTPKVVDGANRVGIFPGVGFQFPFEVTVNIDESIGGPSAGLMFALAIYDTLTPGSLTGGDIVAGTGTIDQAGAVGPIGGIAQKVAAARDAGADLFLVPADNCDGVGRADPGDMRLVRTGTMAEALDAIETWTDDPEAPLPTCEEKS